MIGSVRFIFDLTSEACRKNRGGFMRRTLMTRKGPVRSYMKSIRVASALILVIFILMAACQTRMPVDESRPSNQNLTFIADDQVIALQGPARIVLTSDDLRIEVGGESTFIRASVVDEYGDSVGEGIGVRIEMMEAPGYSGSEKPSFEYPPSDDSVRQVYEGVTDTDGRVEAELFSGCTMGWVRIRSSLTEYENIPSEQIMVLMEPGPPSYIQLALNQASESIGDSLSVAMAVAAWDRYTNPAGYGDTAFIKIEPELNVAYGDIVIPPIPPYPEIPSGWGYTWLRYTCDHSLETVSAIATMGSVADTSYSYSLPVYDPDIYMTADPESIRIEPPDTVAFSDIAARLLDGNGCKISNGIAIFHSMSCGEISGQAWDTTDSEGYAHTRFMIRAYDIPGPPPDPPQCTARVKASLYGYPYIISQVEIVCTRPE